MFSSTFSGINSKDIPLAIELQLIRPNSVIKPALIPLSCKGSNINRPPYSSVNIESSDDVFSQIINLHFRMSGRFPSPNSIVYEYNSEFGSDMQPTRANK